MSAVRPTILGKHDAVPVGDRGGRRSSGRTGPLYLGNHFETREWFMLEMAMIAAHGRRSFLKMALCVLTTGTGRVWAESAYPSRSVDVTIPFAAGGSTDVIARLLCDGLTRHLGAAFVPVNRPGANTNLGTQTVARAKPDGYSLLMASIGLAANPSLYRKLSFVPLRDLAPISLIGNSSTVVVVNPALPVSTAKELIEYIRARPGKVNYASYGFGSGPHLAGVEFQALTKTEMIQIPFKGGGEAATAVLSNQVPVMFSGPLPVLAMIRDGLLRPIAVAADQRLSILPEVATFSEQGVGFKNGTWFGLLAPAGTSEPILAALHSAAVETLREPLVRERLQDLGVEVIANSPAEFLRFLEGETKRLFTLLREANVTME